MITHRERELLSREHWTLDELIALAFVARRLAGMARDGKNPEEIERALQLEEVPEPTPAEKRSPGRPARATKPEKTEEINTRHDGGVLPTQPGRTEERLRAITRAPGPVVAAGGRP